MPTGHIPQETKTCCVQTCPYNCFLHFFSASCVLGINKWHHHLSSYPSHTINLHVHNLRFFLFTYSPYIQLITKPYLFSLVNICPDLCSHPHLPCCCLCSLHIVLIGSSFVCMVFSLVSLPPYDILVYSLRCC